MYILNTITHLPGRSISGYLTSEDLITIAHQVNESIMEAKRRGAKTFTFNEVSIIPFKVHETTINTPPTPFRDISIVAKKDSTLLLELIISIMDE
jgi:hypothetical protein